MSDQGCVKQMLNARNVNAHIELQNTSAEAEISIEFKRYEGPTHVDNVNVGGDEGEVGVEGTTPHAVGDSADDDLEEVEL